MRAHEFRNPQTMTLNITGWAARYGEQGEWNVRKKEEGLEKDPKCYWKTIFHDVENPQWLHVKVTSLSFAWNQALLLIHVYFFRL